MSVHESMIFLGTLAPRWRPAGSHMIWESPDGRPVCILVEHTGKVYYRKGMDPEDACTLVTARTMGGVVDRREAICGEYSGPEDDPVGICEKPRGHKSRLHREMRNGELWAAWGGWSNKRHPSVEVTWDAS